MWSKSRRIVERLRLRMKFWLRLTWLTGLIISMVTLSSWIAQFGHQRITFISYLLRSKQIVMNSQLYGYDFKEEVQKANYLQLRWRRLVKQCKDRNKIIFVDDEVDEIDNVIFNPSITMRLCPVYYISESFWKQLISVLEKSNVKLDESNEPDPNSLPPMLRQFEEAREGFSLDVGVKGIFTQDPYSRLVSVYLYHLYLPGMWTNRAVKIANTFRNYQVDSRCINDVTFDEFLRYIVYMRKTKPSIRKLFVDSQWEPISEICKCCDIEYNFIGKLETFTQDLESLSGILQQGNKSYNTSAIQTVTLLAVNETLYKQWPSEYELLQCNVDLEEVLSRYWKVFQYHGMLPAGNLVHIDRNKNHEFTVDTFRRYLLQEVKKWNGNIQRMPFIQRRTVSEFYRTVSTALKLHIRDRFLDDFELMGYNTRPEDIFR